MNHSLFFHKVKLNTSCYSALLTLLFLKLVSQKKIVAICLVEHIGDIVANEPISREVRKQHPKAIIVWVTRKPYKELLKFNPAINKVITVTCLTSWIKIQKKVRFEAIYDLHFNGRACNICNIPLRKKNVDESINPTNYLNHGGLLKVVCLHNKIDVSDTTPQMYIPTTTYKKTNALVPIEKYIVIHCSSNELIKDWEIEKWNQLVKAILEKYNLHVVEIGASSNLSVQSTRYHNFCGRLSILESAAVIKKSLLFIGIDSGPAHMANAVGTAGVILLGEYYFGMKNYNPYSGNYGNLRNCRIIQSKNSVKNISVDEVLKNVNELIELTHVF